MTNEMISYLPLDTQEFETLEEISWRYDYPADETDKLKITFIFLNFFPF